MTEMTTDQPPGRALTRRWPWTVALLGSLAVLGLCWTLASPIGSSPDDDFHLSSTWCNSTGRPDLCQPTSRPTKDGQRPVVVPALLGPAAACFAFDNTQSAACQSLIRDGDRDVSRANDGLYPDGYYTAMGLLASGRPVESALTMRLLAWAVAVGLTGSALVLAPRPLRRTYLLATLVTCVPLGVFLYASNNPSGPAIAGVGAFWCASLTFLGESSRRRTWAAGALAVAAAVLAMGSRADAGLYLAAAAASAVVQSQGWRAERLARSAALGAVALVGFATAWMSGQTSAAATGFEENDLARPWTSLLWHNLLDLPALWTGSVGTRGLGWLDTRMPDIVSASMITAAVLVVLASRVRWDRIRLAAVALAAVPVTLIPLFVLNANESIVGEFIQPRYLLPMLPIVIGAIVLPSASERQDPPSRRRLIVLGLLVVTAHAAALHANIRRYVTGQDVLSPDLGADVEWWWDMAVRPTHVWVLGSVAFGAAVYLALARMVAADT